MKNNSRLNRLTPFQLISKTGIKQSHLASKMQMPYGSFKNKLSDKQIKYMFTDVEKSLLIKRLKDISEMINETADILRNRSTGL